MEPIEDVVIQESFNFADLWEAVADAVPERTAIVSGLNRWTYRQVDDRASRLAQWMSDRGVVEGSSVGLQMTNIYEHVEGMIAAFKLRATPINLNFRLAPEELHAIYADAKLAGVIHDRAFESQVRTAATGLDIGWVLAAGPAYEEAVASVEPRMRVQRSGSDIYVLYTGGTTGTPKSVEWTVESAFFACVGGGDPTGALGPIATPKEIVDRIVEGVAFVPAPPLMHAAGMWTTLRWLLAGAKVVLIPTYSAQAIVEAIKVEHVTNVNIVGDAMAVRLAAAVEAHGTAGLDSIRVLASGGAPLSEPIRRRLISALPQLTVRDSYGSSETGVHAWANHAQGESSDGRFQTRDTLILDPESLTSMTSDGQTPGLVARHTYVPERYRNDSTASARTFITIDGRAVAVTGDMGFLDAEGRLTLLGRGTTSINTGGEKVFPDEVEGVLRGRPEIEDCLVLGLPDPSWGQRVVALVQTVNGQEPDVVGLKDHCRSSLAGFKVPKEFLLVAAVPRTAAGKADYGAAVELADKVGREMRP